MGKTSIKKLKPTLEEAFQVGKLEGMREVLVDISLLIKDQPLLEAYIKARIKNLTEFNNNPFKRSTND